MTREEAILLFEISTPKECSECYKAHDFTCSGADARRCEAYRMAIAALREQGAKHSEAVTKCSDLFDEDGGEILNFKTNADQIRSMTDEELAELLENLSACNRCRRYGNDCFPVWDALHWLKQPYKEA